MKIRIEQVKSEDWDSRRNKQSIQIISKELPEESFTLFPAKTLGGASFYSSLNYSSVQQKLIELVKECVLLSEKKAFILGAPCFKEGKKIGLYYIQNGKVLGFSGKKKLSKQEVCEGFVSGEGFSVLERQGNKIAYGFVEDFDVKDFENKEIDILLCFGSSPFGYREMDNNENVLAHFAKAKNIPVVFVNKVGGEGSLLFEGRSFCISPQGTEVFLPDFEECTQEIDTANMQGQEKTNASAMESMYKALVMGIREYMSARGFKKAVLGLSGGLDSALVAALAVAALGKENVRGILMPSEFSTQHSVEDAVELAQNLGMGYEILPIKKGYETLLETLQPVFAGTSFGLAEENLQARIRGTLVMSVSNKTGEIVLNTSNKSEIAVGYGTLYGDMCGSLAVIGDLYKTEVIEMANYLNKEKEVIPQHTISKPPSAELRHDQKDCDSLPDYAILDKILWSYIEENLSFEEISIKYPEIETPLLKEILRKVGQCEYKRRQAAPCLKLKPNTLGIDRLMPF